MKRITFLTGYYGSGKTEVALNLAITKHIPYIVDLDIINPYFRSREQGEILKAHGIQVLSNSLKGGIHADVPFIGGEVFTPFVNPSIHAIYDLGGNDLGAKLLLQFSDYLVQEPIDLVMVINPYRMETSTIPQIKELQKAIENASGVKVTGIINNTNLLKETTLDSLLEGNTFMEEVAKELHLPILYTMVNELWLPMSHPLQGEVIPFKRYFEKPWL